MIAYPAFYAIFKDPERTPTRLVVFMAIQPPTLDFTEARLVKVDAVAMAARVSTGGAAESLSWLIQRGYLQVHATDGRGVRAVTLATEVPARTPAT